MKPILVATLGASTLFAAAGQVCLKLGAQRAASPIDYLNWQIGAGLALYGAGVILWLVALSQAPLSLVYPFTILTFIFVGLGSALILHERTTALTFVGWGVMCLGLVVVQLGGR